MTEKDYILVRMLSEVMTANRAVRELHPYTDPLDPDPIDQAEVVAVVQQLERWQERLFAEVEKARDRAG